MNKTLAKFGFAAECLPSASLDMPFAHAHLKSSVANRQKHGRGRANQLDLGEKERGAPEVQRLSGDQPRQGGPSRQVEHMLMQGDTVPTGSHFRNACCGRCFTVDWHVLSTGRSPFCNDAILPAANLDRPEHSAAMPLSPRCIVFCGAAQRHRPSLMRDGGGQSAAVIRAPHRSPSRPRSRNAVSLPMVAVNGWACSIWHRLRPLRHRRRAGLAKARVGGQLMLSSPFAAVAAAQLNSSPPGLGLSALALTGAVLLRRTRRLAGGRTTSDVLHLLAGGGTARRSRAAWFGAAASLIIIAERHRRILRAVFRMGPARCWSSWASSARSAVSVSGPGQVCVIQLLAPKGRAGRRWLSGLAIINWRPCLRAAHPHRPRGRA